LQHINYYTQTRISYVSSILCFIAPLAKMHICITADNNNIYVSIMQPFFSLFYIII